MGGEAQAATHGTGTCVLRVLTPAARRPTPASCASRRQAGNLAGSRPAIWSSVTRGPPALSRLCLPRAHLQVVEVHARPERGLGRERRAVGGPT